jgi:hypothetical protein
MTSQDTLALITEIKKFSAQLNEWEKAFLGNILCHKKISNKQEKLLVRLYEKATGGGVYATKQYFKR